jgi:NAD(P)-dependent dehydrogenase (short-subunit alcohol dehydrogenase family)
MQSILHPIIGPADPPQEDLSGRTVFVTGGALGIGYETSRNLALQKARVIMLNRKEDQGDDAISKIQAEAKEQGISVDINWVQLDLGNLNMVQEVFTRLSKEEERCDLFFANGAINANQPGLDADGIDRHFGVNCLGHFLAINLLLPLMRKTSKIPGAPAPRIVFQSSEQHRLAPSNVHFGSLRELNDPNIDNTQIYCRTKLGMILYTKYLVNDIIGPNKDNIYVLAVHPGAVNTAMQQQWESAYPGLTGKIIKNVSLALGRDPEQGSYAGLWAAISPEIIEKGYNGYYFTDPGQLGKESSQANDPWLQWACWDLSERLVKEKLGSDALLPWK